MAIEYVTGPAHIYCSFPTRAMVNSGTGLPAALSYPTTIYYVGTADSVPRLDHSPIYRPVQNDVTGQAQEIDQEYQGQSVSMVATLNRYNEYVFTELDKIVAAGGLGTGTRGKDVAGNIGSLMIQEGNTFHVWVHYPYYSKYGSGFYMPAGYHYTACMMQPYQLQPGTKTYTRLFPIRGFGVYNPADLSILYYDSTMTTIPAIPPVTATGLVT